jgi:hypothetical protein
MVYVALSYNFALALKRKIGVPDIVLKRVFPFTIYTSAAAGDMPL